MKIYQTSAAIESAKRTSQVQDELSFLEKEIEAMEGEFDVLDKSLICVVRQEPCNTCESPKPDSLVPVAERIRAARLRVGAISVRIRYVVGHIEL